MQIGFVVVARDEHVAFHLFAQGRPGRLPLVSYSEDAGGFQAALMGRLYYRRELASRLRDAGIHEEPEGDAALALAAYRAFGLPGVERLEGDFAVVIHDRNQRRLIASRDPMGGYPLYWLDRGGTVAFGTLLRPLVDLLPDRSLCLDFLRL